MKKLISFIFLLIIINSASASNTQKIHQLQNQIQNLKTLLSKDHLQKVQLQRQLQQAEINVGNLAVELENTQQQLSQQKTLLNKLNQQQQQYQAQLQQQQASLSTQLRAIYMLGNQQYLKVLLNQQDPNQFGRIVTYYRYINHQRLQVIEQFNQTLENLTQNKQQILQHTQQLTTLQKQQQQERTQLVTVKQDRVKLLQSLQSQIQNKQLRLQTLLANKQALERVVSHLEKKPYFVTSNTMFVKPHGKLSWPTRGKIIERFGTQIEQSQLKWSGILIKAPEGQPVYAISPGEVVFANWMAGYGLLLIINHGNGYMTIYGRNHSLYKKVGDRIKAGDLIATVGNTGGYRAPALYFAIRQNGKALNPERWCG